MAGQPLSEFTTFMASTGPAWMTDTESVVNEALRNFYTGNRVAFGDMGDMTEGGSSIKDTTFLKEKSTFSRYNPNESFSYLNHQTGTQWEAQWAFAYAYMAWEEKELGLNIESMGSKYRAQVYKKVMRQKHQNLWTDVCNSMDDEFWARPYQTEMESSTPTGPRRPYSIPVFVNEHPSGMIPALVDEGATLWETSQGINPTLSNQEKWRCYQACYNANGYDATGADDTKANTTGYSFSTSSALAAAKIFPTFSKAWYGLHFDRLPMKPEYSDKTTAPQVIWCTTQGITNYEFALRTNQDEFKGMGSASGQDPAYPGPSFRGTPLEVISALESALLYQNGIEAVTELGYNAAGTDADTAAFRAGPRYYFVNTQYLKFVAHANKMCTLTKPLTPTDQPFSRVQVMDLWNNIVCRSPRHQGIVSPASDTTDA